MLPLSRLASFRSRCRGLALLALLVVAALVPSRLVAVTPQPASEAATPAVTGAAPAVPLTEGTAAASAPVAATEVRGAPAVPAPGDVYVLLVGDGREVTDGGNTADVARARELRNQFGGDLLWVRRAGTEYLSRDPATIERVRAILQPQRELGVRHGQLDKQQEALGAQQAGLGVQQANLRAEHRRLEDQVALRGVQLPDWASSVKNGQNNGPGANAAPGHDEGERKLELLRQMHSVDAEQEKLARLQEALVRRQKGLARQQEELRGEQERAAIEAEQRLRDLFGQAIARGTAEPIGKAAAAPSGGR